MNIFNEYHLNYHQTPKCWEEARVYKAVGVH